MRKSANMILGIGLLVCSPAVPCSPSAPQSASFPLTSRSVFPAGSMVRPICQQPVAGMAEKANNRALGTAASGTALGLALGAATGDGHAATFGGVSGAAIGGTIGADQSERAGYSLQRRYDIAFAQCMYSRGNQVPGFKRSAAPPPPPPEGLGGPPPPGPRG